MSWLWILPAFPSREGLRKSIYLHLYRVCDFFAITTCHGHGQGNALVPCPIQHHLVSRLQTRETQFQATQAVTLVRIRTCQIKHQPW